MNTVPIPPTIEWRRNRIRLIDQRAPGGRYSLVVDEAASDEAHRRIRRLQASRGLNLMSS